MHTLNDGDCVAILDTACTGYAIPAHLLWPGNYVFLCLKQVFVVENLHVYGLIKNDAAMFTFIEVLQGRQFRLQHLAIH